MKFIRLNLKSMTLNKLDSNVVLLKYLPLVGAMLFVLLASVAQAKPAGNWSVEYFTVVGNVCTNTHYSPMVPGSGGFGDPSKIEPLVFPGTNICVHITISGGQSNKQVLWKLEGIVSPITIGSTDSKGNFDGKFIVHIPNNIKFGKNSCMEPPERVDYGSSVKKPKMDSSNQIQPMWNTPDFDIDHMKICNSTPPSTSVPEFSFGLPLAFLGGLASILLVRKYLAKV